MTPPPAYPQPTEAPTLAPPGEPQDAIQLRDYWRILVRRRNVVLSCLVGLVTLVCVLTFLATPEYEAAATVQIERQVPEVLNFRDVLGGDAAGYQDYYQTQYKILQSRAVLRIAAEQLDLVNRPEYVARRQSPIDRLRRRVGTRAASGDAAPGVGIDGAVDHLAAGLSIQPVPKSHLVRVLFTDESPLLARDSANAVVEAYRQFNLEAHYATTAEAADFLTKQVAQLQTEIAVKERQLQEHSANEVVLAIGGQSQDIASQALADLNARYVAAKGQLVLAEAQYEATREALPEALPEVLNSPLISGLKQRHADIERQYRQMADRFKADWPALGQLREELNQAEERLVLETAGIAHQVRSVAEADFHRVKAEVARLAERVEEQKREVQRVRRAGIEVAGLRSEIDTQRSFLDDLTGRQNQTEMSERLRDTRASNIRVVDLAETPERPVRPHKLFNLLLSVVLGLVLGVGGALLTDHLDYTVKNEQDVERLTGLRVLGHVSLFRPLRVVAGGSGSRGAAHDPVDLGSHFEPRSIFAEAFKNLRTSILLASPERPPRHIVVTSSEPGDGKSTISVNLAVVLAQMGRRVLLVDADLRRPRVHGMLRLPNDVGLSSYLTGNASLDSAFQSCEIPNLSILTSGPIPPTPSELLGSPSLQALLERLSEDGMFDHVILDSTPALQVADSVILASRADATILVVRSGKTARDSVTQAVIRLRQARAHVAGAVLNAMPEHEGYYGRYRSYPSEGERPAEVAVTRRWRHRRGAGNA